MRLGTRRLRVVLLGASFDTGNLGVSALGEASIKCIHKAHPDAEIDIVGMGRQRKTFILSTVDGGVVVNSWPIRFCPNITVSDHYIKIIPLLCLARLIPLIKSNGQANTTLSVLLHANCVYDITGGDSFSDIYGMKRFVLGYLTKRLCQMLKVPFVMLPQTYGPYQRMITKRMARRVLAKSFKIYSRDSAGVETVRRLLRGKKEAKLVPDVAFVLDRKRPAAGITTDIETHRAGGNTLIGLNVSGLLYHGGYTRDNQFGLKIDYPVLMRRVIDLFLSKPGTTLLLVPHVIPSDKDSVENDYHVCRLLLDQMPEDLADRIRVIEPGLDAGETKYLIGQCDFFVGARMHATIAALSQMVPAVGLAYSDKFTGVFETAGVPDCVVDMRQLSETQVLECLDSIYQDRMRIRQRLQLQIPAVQESVYSMFGNG